MRPWGGALVASSAVLCLLGCSMFKDSDPDAASGEKTPPNVTCTGFPQAPQDCTKIMFVCPGANGWGDTPDDPSPMPQPLEASDDVCILLAPGHYEGLPMSAAGIRVIGAGSDKVTIGGPVFIVGNDSVVEPPLQLGRIEIRGATFTGKELLFGSASEAVYTDMAVTNGVGGAFSAVYIKDVKLQSVSFVGTKHDADGYSIAAAFSHCQSVEASELNVSNNAGTGLAVVNGALALSDSTINNNGTGGLALIVEKGVNAGQSVVSGSSLSGNKGTGLLVSGTKMEAADLVISGTTKYNDYAPGNGIVIKSKSDVVIHDVTSSSNLSSGIIIDESVAVLGDCLLKDNGRQGVSIQRGWKPEGRFWAVEILGDKTVCDGNGVAAVGALDAHSVRIGGGSFTNTKLANVSKDVAKLAGDGIAILGGSTHVLIQGAKLSGNRRAQILFDGVDGTADGGMQVESSVLEDTGTEEFGIVVQNGSGEVNIADDVIQPATLPTEPPEDLIVSENPEPIPDDLVFIPK